MPRQSTRLQKKINGNGDKANTKVTTTTTSKPKTTTTSSKKKVSSKKKKKKKKIFSQKTNFN